MFRIGLLVLVLFVLFCTLNSMREAHSASNQTLKDCKAEANWALMLRRDLDAGGAVNVMPADEPVLKIVKEHQGTTEELWWKIYTACGGHST